jgi:hypothetical protein
MLAGPLLDCVDIDPRLLIDHAHSPSDSLPALHVGQISRPQVEYCVGQLQLWVSLFVLKNQTPFMHVLAYPEDKPLAYQDALSVCSLYMNKTPQNRDVIFRILDDKLDALINQTMTWVTIKDSLLGMQAMLLYQIIRLFDGCPRQRAHAERDFALLDSWTCELHKSYCASEQHLLGSSISEENWILLESVRRTVMTSVMLRDLFKAQTTGFCDLVPMMSLLPVSKNSTVWDSASEEQRQKTTQPQTVVTYREFTNAWNEGTITELGQYETLLLIACRFAIKKGLVDY